MEGPLGSAIKQDLAHQPHEGDDDHKGQQAAHAARVAPRTGSLRRRHPPIAWSGVVTLRSIAPILPTGDMDRMRAHYEHLGFSVRVHGGGYGTASRDGFSIHFRLAADHNPDTGAGALYLAVSDADALHAEWVAAGVGETSDLFDPGFGVWEAAHTDADGNLIRFGSPVGERRVP